MNNESYAWWKLFKTQYSWNNDKVSIYITLVISALYTIVMFSTASVTFTSAGEPVEVGLVSVFAIIYWLGFTLYLLTLYHIIKFIVLGCIICGGVVYFANKGEVEDKLEARNTYKEMLTWRK